MQLKKKQGTALSQGFQVQQNANPRWVSFSGWNPPPPPPPRCLLKSYLKVGAVCNTRQDFLLQLCFLHQFFIKLHASSGYFFKTETASAKTFDTVMLPPHLASVLRSCVLRYFGVNKTNKFKNPCHPAHSIAVIKVFCTWTPKAALFPFVTNFHSFYLLLMATSLPTSSINVLCPHLRRYAPATMLLQQPIESTGYERKVLRQRFAS
ncbi:hypothetical protein JZ751_003473, partial [Albula glossodonta]